MSRMVAKETDTRLPEGGSDSDGISARLLGEARLVVVLATHNGAGWIHRVLEGYVRQEGVTFPWALLVVDNASTDSTAAVLAGYADKLPLVVLHEARPGKNVALNRALAAVANPSCDYIFTDDDAVPEPDFLAQWQAAIAAHRDHELFGASVLPLFEDVAIEVPQRYAAWHEEIYARNIRPEGPIAPGSIFGPNMAVSGKVIRAGFRFNEAIGPSSADAAYPMGSETEFCVRVAREAGLSSWFAPGPQVHHIVRPAQATEDFILARAFRHGKGCAIKEDLAERKPDNPLKIQIVIAVLTILGLFGRHDARWNAAWQRGFRAGLKQRRRAERSAAARPAAGLNEVSNLGERSLPPAA